MADLQVQNASAGNDNLIAGVNYGTLVKNIVLQIQREQPPALKQLPRAIADFVGRRSIQEKITEFLAANQAVAISAVAGMGGVGKSALAVQVAHCLVSRYPDAQLYVNLQGTDRTLVRQPQDVIREFLRAFGLEDIQIAAMTEKVQQDCYRSILAELRVLLLLDNAKDAAQVEYLLPGRGCRVLVTSREPLGLAGVQSVRLEVLEPPEALALLQTISGRETLIPIEQAISANIGELCGQLPLALRIAGAILQKRPHWSWEKLQGRLQQEQNRLTELARLHQLVNPTEDLDVRSCLALSYDLLEATEQQILAQLSAMPGPDFSIWLAQSITHNSEVANC